MTAAANGGQSAGQPAPVVSWAAAAAAVMRGLVLLGWGEVVRAASGAAAVLEGCWGVDRLACIW